MADSRGIVVLTTHERCGYFTAALGHDIDLRMNPKREPPLDDLLHNVIVAGGRLAIIDEAFFVSVDDLALGLERFIREEVRPERIRLIVVCTQRHAGDAFLAFLVMYCGVFDIIYEKSGVEVSMELIRLLEKGNTRSDVLHLVEMGRWPGMRSLQLNACVTEDLGHETQGEAEPGDSLFKKMSNKFLIDVTDVKLMCVQIEFTSITQ